MFLKCVLFLVSEHSFADDPQSATSLPVPLKCDTTWPECVNKFLLHLREIGLVFMRKRSDGYFFIDLIFIHFFSYFFLTPLFSSIVAMDNLLAKDAVVNASRDKGFLVTETNYRISAYTNSNLHLSILSTFTKLLLRFDGFVVANMTRESVMEAFKVGITARQITQFLRSNAYYKTIETHGHLHCVPPTVIYQVCLIRDKL
jgi:transcription initiation factor TFIIH subunit 4